jgi:hypothetical protein
MTVKITRRHEGSYVATDGVRTVSILRIDEWQGSDKWQARADWANDLYTDPLPTKRVAVFNAKLMLKTAADESPHDAQPQDHVERND